MTTHWFTIAEGENYSVHAEQLRRSLDRFGIELHIRASGAAGSTAAKRQKITGILESPRNCARVVYLDADTLVLNPERIDRVNGSWRIPWRIPAAACLPRTADPERGLRQLHDFYTRHDLPAFAEGGPLQGVEWNSGVIVGDRDRLIALAREWAVWWDRLQEAFDGQFRRDQVSYRLAYHKVWPDGPDLPMEYNWVASYFGVNPNANIVHRTMVRRVSWLEKAWEGLVARRLAGEEVRTANRHFDVTGLTTGIPALHRQTDLGGEADLLRQTLAFARPRRALLCGVSTDDRRWLPVVREFALECQCVPALDRVTPDALRDNFDYILCCSVDYTMSDEQLAALAPSAVCCFLGIHDLAQHRFLYGVPYVRILAPGFGLYSHDSRIAGWQYR